MCDFSEYFQKPYEIGIIAPLLQVGKPRLHKVLQITQAHMASREESKGVPPRPPISALHMSLTSKLLTHNQRPLHKSIFLVFQLPATLTMKLEWGEQ